MSWEFFLICTIITIIMQGYFAMMEMAIVSYNKVKLQYHVHEGDRKAIWLSKLLKKPTYLFGTTLIGVNFFLELGSECSRMMYAALGLNPDYAMATQILAVVLFAELIPLFAARSYPEHVVRLGITAIYILSKVFIPFIWILDAVCRLIDWILRCPPPSHNYLTREELQKAVETKDAQGELDHLVEAIFVLKTKTPKELMEPLDRIPMASSEATIQEIELSLKSQYVPYMPLYYKKPQNIVGILYTRDLLTLAPDALIRDVAKSPWFITERNSLFQILKQFQWNNQHIAVVLDRNGHATGILTLDALVEELFAIDPIEVSQTVIVNRSFSADTEVSVINQTLRLSLPEGGTLEDLMTRLLGHAPSKLERIRVKQVELTLESSPLLADKTIRIQSL